MATLPNLNFPNFFSLTDLSDENLSLVKQVKNILLFNPLSVQPYKMVEHTQTIRRLFLMNSLTVFNKFVGLVIKGLKTTSQNRLATFVQRSDVNKVKKHF